MWYGHNKERTLKIRSFKELVAQLGNDWQDVVARTLASASYTFVASKLNHLGLERDFGKRHLDSLSSVSRGIIALMCHTLSGVTHTIPVADGPVGKFSATLLGTMFTDIAAHIEQENGQPVTIDMPFDSWRTDPAGAQILLQPAVQEKAARHLADRFEQDCRGESTANPTASQRVRSFLSRVGVSIGEFAKNESKGVEAGVKKYTEAIRRDTHRRQNKWL